MSERRSFVLACACACAVWLASCGRGVSKHPLEGLGETAGKGGATGGAGGASVGGSAGSSGAGAEGKADGATCVTDDDCASDVCLLDVIGVSRCCEADCRADGRNCSTDGECVCSSATQDVGGDCLLRDGEGCRASSQCANNHCVDDVCCDTACGQVCERCDDPNRGGTCVLDDEDTSCEQSGFECTARGRCRLPLSLSCALDADCESDHCALSVSGGSICCESACDDTCERCGETGVCDAFPTTHPDCPAKTCAAKTTCLEERTPAPHQCSGHGECAECERIPTRAGIPCGVGEQCDGAGACETTGVGRVAAGLRHTCAIRANGNVVCWGDNTWGQLGAAFDRTHVGDDERVDLVPQLELDFGHDVVALTAGVGHTCALFDDGTVRCWGLGDDLLFVVSPEALLGTTAITYERVGAVDFVHPLNTGNVKLRDSAVQISAATGGGHTCAVLASGQVSCWGFNADGQCGDGTQTERGVQGEFLPVLDLGGERALEVKAAPGHTCVLLEGGAVTCFGEGNFGRLGYASNADRLAPLVPPEQTAAHVAIGGPARHIATGLGHTCALLDGGKVRCWGYNNDGQLGYGHNLNIGDDETPEAAAMVEGPAGRPLLGGDVPIGGDVLALSQVVDSRAMCALLDGGTVRCWGQNNRGQLGYGHTDALGTTYTPEQLAQPVGSFRGGNVDFGGSALALADGGRCALMVDGKLYCWGDNEDGELGLPDHFPDGSKTLTPFEMGPVLWEPSTLSSKAP
ncbi:MAG TPA: hypothetical protein VMS65_16330 [Polyangiaceae bacterium]|nr:hypothetical protein [Polyangiaceae bacterium]